MLLPINNGFVRGQEVVVNEIIRRIWTREDGSQVSATFAAKLGDVVKVEKFDGTMVSFSYSSLVEADQNYVDAVVRKFGSAPGARTWSDVNGKNFLGSFVRVEGSEIEFMLVNEERLIRIETLFLVSQDIEFILDELNSSLPRSRKKLGYRVWTYRDARNNELRMIARYSRTNDDDVLVNQDKKTILVPLTRLSQKDLDYILEVDDSTAQIIEPLRDRRRVGLPAGDTRVDTESEAPEMSPIWWISLGLVFLLMLGLISIKYVYESGEREFDDEI